VHPFVAGQTITVPRDVPHRIEAVGAEPLEIVAVLAASPVAVFLPDEQLLELPWPS
jgi:oxalate decarboxylase/phosphoglucose isomerase-like protein (cupin superfamily)